MFTVVFVCAYKFVFHHPFCRSLLLKKVCDFGNKMANPMTGVSRYMTGTSRNPCNEISIYGFGKQAMKEETGT